MRHGTLDLADEEESRDFFDQMQNALRDMFAAMIEEYKEAGHWPYSDSDEIALNEGFNNWTDSLCKDGEISDYLYDNVTRD